MRATTGALARRMPGARARSTLAIGPTSTTVTRLKPSNSPGLRSESDSSSGATITLDYSPTLLGVWGADRDHVLVVGDEGICYQYDGQQWVGRFTHSSSALNGIWGSDWNNVYAVGNVQLSQDAVINGNVYAVGNVQLHQDATINGNYPLPYEGCPLFLFGSIGIQTWEIMRQ